MANVVLEIKNLTKKYKNRIAVDNLNFEVFAGEIFGFLGVNGAGKSTTIKMITGLATITYGDVLINGYSIKTDFEDAIMNVGAIIESPDMYSYMTGFENLKYFANLYDNISNKRINEVVKLVGLENRINDKVKHYSMGMKQRLGIAQALLHSPKLLILDEPTNGLDPNGIQEMRIFLKRIAHKENIAVLISSHILSEMEQLCDTIGIIENGKLIEIKTIDQIRKGIEGSQVYAIKVDYPNYAGMLVYKKYNIEVELAGSNIILHCSEDIIPNVISYLTSKNLSIFGVSTIQKSLEEVFVNILKSNSNNKKSTSIN
ncbi:MAG: ABC transporter ATP-binding protein [Clostridia bacterium]|nr:ABC transporter ATP-binding protein [Clostridia bacterium]